MADEANTRVSGVLRELERIRALRAEQHASGDPVFCCPACRGDSRRDARLPVQSLICECCGEPVTLRRMKDGMWLLEPGLLAVEAVNGLVR